MKHLQLLRKATVKYADGIARIKLMNEILQGIGHNLV